MHLPDLIDIYSTLAIVHILAKPSASRPNLPPPAKQTCTTWLWLVIYSRRKISKFWGAYSKNLYIRRPRSSSFSYIVFLLSSLSSFVSSPWVYWWWWWCPAWGRPLQRQFPSARRGLGQWTLSFSLSLSVLLSASFLYEFRSDIFSCRFFTGKENLNYRDG